MAPSDRADEIGACREADIGIGELQHRAVLQRAGERTGERDLEPIEDPGDAEGGHHQGVESAPGQPVEPGRDVAFNNAGCVRHARPRLIALPPAPP